MAHLYQELLQEQGNDQVRLVTTGFEGWVDPHQWAGVDADCAIIDLDLPLITGDELLEVAASVRPQMRRVVATARWGMDPATRALAHAVLEKPFAIRDLLEATHP